MKTDQIEQIVQAVLEEVLKRLEFVNEVSILDKESVPQTISAAKPLVLAVDPHREKYDEKYLSILDNYQQNTEWQHSSENSDVLVLNYLNFNRMTYLANLQTNDPLTELILGFLLKKKPVLVLAWEYKLSDIRATSRFGLWRHYDEILSTLESYGVKFIKSDIHLEFTLEKELKQKKSDGKKVRQYS